MTLFTLGNEISLLAVPQFPAGKNKSLCHFSSQEAHTWHVKRSKDVWVSLNSCWLNCFFFFSCFEFALVVDVSKLIFVSVADYSTMVHTSFCSPFVAAYDKQRNTTTVFFNPPTIGKRFSMQITTIEPLHLPQCV